MGGGRGVGEGAVGESWTRAHERRSWGRGPHGGGDGRDSPAHPPSFRWYCRMKSVPRRMDLDTSLARWLGNCWAKACRAVTHADVHSRYE